MEAILELQKDVNELRQSMKEFVEAHSTPAREVQTSKSDPLAEISKELADLKASMTTQKKREVTLKYETNDLKLLGFAALGAVVTPVIGGMINTVLPQVPASAEAFIVGMIGYGLTFKKSGAAAGIFLGMVVTSAAMLLQTIIRAVAPGLNTQSTPGQGAFTL